MKIAYELIEKLNEVNLANGRYKIERYPKDRMPLKIKEDFKVIFFLVYNYKYQNTSFDILIFDKEILENKDYYIFGKNLIHSLDYVIDKLTGEILVLDDSGNISFKCAKDCSSFINSLINIVMLELLYSNEGQVDEERRLAFQNKSVELAGGKIYQDYYRLII
jgi:hypothetical protein